jgi:amidophosphoribosyltransferase
MFLTDNGSVYAARDPKGFRPLVLGIHEETNTYMIASESCAFSAVGAKLLRDIQPGEIIKLDKAGLKSELFAQEPHSHCAFEFTYFAHPTSIMEGVNVYVARKRIGQLLAKKYPVDADLVIPVPDSARPAALGYSEALGLSFEEGLLKNRYSKKGSMRSFIEPYGETRVEINKGIIPIKEVIQKKKVVVIDDSIVRGTSSHSIVRMLRAAGAQEISMIVTYPPIRFPCYAGIDFPSQEELIAFQQTSNETSTEKIGQRISKVIGADFTAYNDNSTLAQAIGIKPIFKTRKQMKGEE